MSTSGQAPGSDGALGYKQELKRSLSAFDLLVYGLVFIAPTGCWSNFGFVYNTSHGMVPLVYVVGFVAMLFTALSYMAMTEAFPVAGSVYAYAGRSIGPNAGFLAGWTLLLDYLLLPTLVYVICAVTVHAVVPGLPKRAIFVVFLAINTAANLLGVESMARASVVLLVLQLVIIAAFTAFGLVALAHGVHGAHLALDPFISPAGVKPAQIFGALSLAVLSFLGFDAIATLTEEAKGGARAVGAATLFSLLIAAALFVAQTYLASLFILGRPAFPKGDPTATAFLEIALTVGGPALRWTVSVLAVLASGIAAALTAQAATARLIYSMARDGMLPRLLASVGRRTQAPTLAIVLVALITLGLGMFMVDQLELLTSMVNFGALTGFLVLHVSVVAHHVVRKRSRRWLAHLVSPAIGFAVIAYVLLNAERNAKIAGGAWLSVGVAIVVVLALTGRSGAALLEEETRVGADP